MNERPGSVERARPSTGLGADILIPELARPVGRSASDHAGPRLASVLRETTQGGARRMSLRPGLGEPNNPALRQHAKERRAKVENRIADVITRFAGSMDFVYVHIVWFVLWITIPVERYPFGLLTMIVSLESIFLSTFILISQNRADERRQVLADEQWDLVKARDAQIETMLSSTEEILRLARSTHELTLSHTGTPGRP
jgi:uncharacterized membrane protein